VPQKAVLFQGTIAENLAWGKKDATEKEMEQALSVAQGMDIITSKKNGLQEQILQGGKNLSGGQRQRLTIARAIVKKPKLLILDDSASALDFATDARLRKALKEENGNRTVFLVSQRASTIRQADRILVLEDGVLVGNGTHGQLMESCQVYQEIVHSQEEAAGRKEVTE
jgi:ABC-type multidrug transport system fused ATPase/permease subunit